MSGRIGTALAAAMLAWTTLACGGAGEIVAPAPQPVPLPAPAPAPTPAEEAEAARAKAEAAMAARDFDALWSVMAPETCYGEGCAWQGKDALQHWKRNPSALQYAKDAIRSCTLNEDIYYCANPDEGSMAEFVRTPGGFRLARVDVMN